MSKSNRKHDRLVAAEGAVRFVEASANAKLSRVGYRPGRERPQPVPMRPFVSATAVSIAATCPNSCPFKGAPGTPGGCYEMAGFGSIGMHKLDDSAWGLTADEVTAEEACQMDAAFPGGVPQDGARGGRDVRLHTGGDVGSTKGARRLAGAAERLRARGSGCVWTYTHRWPEIPRTAWGNAISVLASVEKAENIEVARKSGYAAAIVVEQFPNGDKAFTLPGSTARIVPCPAETRDLVCTECRLCMNADKLLANNTAIAFEVHGGHSRAARESLVQLRTRKAASH